MGGEGEDESGVVEAADAPLQFVKPVVVDRKSEQLAPRPPARTERKRRQEEVRRLRREHSARVSAVGDARRRQLQLQKHAAREAADFRMVKQQRTIADTKARNASAMERREQEEQLIAETRARAREVAANTAASQARYAAKVMAQRKETIEEVRSQKIVARAARQAPKAAGAVSVATRSTRADILRRQTEVEKARLADRSLKYKQQCKERVACQQAREQRHAAKASARHTRMKVNQAGQKKAYEEAAEMRDAYSREEKRQTDFLLCKCKFDEHNLQQEIKSRQIAQQNLDGVRDGKSPHSPAATIMRRPMSARPVSARTDNSLNSWGVVSTQQEDGIANSVGHGVPQQQQQQQQQQQPVVQEEQQQHLVVQREQRSSANVEHCSSPEPELESESEPDPELELQPELEPKHLSHFETNSTRTGRFTPNTSLQTEGSVEGSWTVGPNPNANATLLRAASREISQAKPRAAVHIIQTQTPNAASTSWRGWSRAQKQLRSSNGRQAGRCNHYEKTHAYINRNEAASSAQTPWPTHADSDFLSELGDAYGHGEGQVSPLATETQEGIKRVPIPQSAALAVRDILKAQANDPSATNSCSHSSRSSLGTSTEDLLRSESPTEELEHGSSRTSSHSVGGTDVRALGQTQNLPSFSGARLSYEDESTLCPNTKCALTKASAGAAEQEWHGRVIPPVINVDEEVTVVTTPRHRLLALPTPMRPRTHLLADGPLLDRTRIMTIESITSRSDNVRAVSSSKQQRWRRSDPQPTQLSRQEIGNRPGSADGAEPEGSRVSRSGPMRPWSARNTSFGADDFGTERPSSSCRNECRLHSPLQCRAAVPAVDRASCAATKAAGEVLRQSSNQPRGSKLIPHLDADDGAPTESVAAAAPSGIRSRHRPCISTQLLQAPYAANRAVDVSLVEADEWPALPVEQSTELERGSIHSLHLGSGRPTTCTITSARTQRKEQLLFSEQRLVSTTAISSSSNYFNDFLGEPLSEPPMMLQGVRQGAYVNVRNLGVTAC